MKKLLTLTLLALMCVGGFAQQVVLVFTGKDATLNTYVQLSRIEITDLTQGWTETLTYPDTMAILTVGTGIEENAANAAFGLAQNNPNPFNGTTDVNLSITESGPVSMAVTDVNGRVVETFLETSLQYGAHQFRVNVAATGVYFLTARQNGKTSSVKMVNNGGGANNAIEYAGTVAVPVQSKNGVKGTINRAFAYGDAMTYKGFAVKYGVEVEGEIKEQTQILSENIDLLIDYSTIANPNDGIPCPNMPTLTDVEGNTYNTVQIGSQCWMKENLRTQKYADNTPISQGSGTSTTDAYWYYPNNDTSNQAVYGLLYNWKAVMRNSSSSTSNPSNVQGICPTGWHVPSDAEWTQLTDYVSSQSAYCCSGNSAYIAKALASTTGWDSLVGTCCIGGTPTTNNATGFSALPAGNYYNSYGYFGGGAFYWSATEGDGWNAYWNAYYRVLIYEYSNVSRYHNYKTNGFSVRCVRDEGSTVSFPSVTTFNVTNIASTTATCGGDITSDGGATVTARGVCWSTSQNPTVSGSHTTDGTGTGSFTSSITGLTAGTTYYVRAYATNSVGTAYGAQKSFTTLPPFTCGTSTLTDVDGNTYNTVQIGSQCWMKENLRTQKYADNTPISQGSDTSTTDAYWYYPNDDTSNQVTYGLLYNWPAVMHNSSSSSSNPSNVQGICPNGWHVPSDAEWTQLTDYVSSQSQYVCSSNTSYIAKALADTTGWNSYTGSDAYKDCYPGYNSVSNNATGFGAMPAGNYYGSYGGFCTFAYFWSAESSGSNAYGRSMYFNYAAVDRVNYAKNGGFSVRCVRD